MPTVIMLDTSFSMSKYVKMPTESTETDQSKMATDEKPSVRLTKRDLSHLLVRQIVDYISKTDKFDHIALVAVSTSSEVVCPFTRDHEQILNSLESLKVGNSCSLKDSFGVVSDLVTDEWACLTNIQVLFITDQVDSFQENSVKSLCFKLRENRKILKEYYLSNGIDFDERIHVNSLLNDDLLQKPDFDPLLKKSYLSCKFPFSFPNRFDIICLNDEEIDEQNSSLYKHRDRMSLFEFDEDNFVAKRSWVQRLAKSSYLSELIKLNGSNGKLHLTKCLSKDYITNEFGPKFVEELYSPFKSVLKCGNMKSNVIVLPPPIPFKGFQDFIYVIKEIDKIIDVCGFISISDLTTPATLSRHLILIDESGAGNELKTQPESDLNTSNEVNNTSISSANDEAIGGSQDVDSLANLPSVGSFAFLLNSCLRSENMAAIVKLANDWYGAIHSWQEVKNDPKKRSHMMLSIFVPGGDVLNNIINKVNQATKVVNPSAASQQPIKSYTKGSIVWYHASNLQSDIQKVIRNAKKIPDKMQIFYKELNRVRRAALTFGFYDLLEALSLLLQRELTTSQNQNPEFLLQLTHSITCLRSPEFKEYRKDIQPFISNISSISSVPQKIRR